MFHVHSFINGVCIALMASLFGWYISDWQFWAWLIVATIWSFNLLAASENLDPKDSGR